MRLLVLTPQFPYPPQQGTTIRNYNIIKHLAPRHDITLVSFGTEAELENGGPLRSLCRHIEIVSYPLRSFTRRLFTTFASPLPDMALRLKSDLLHEKVSSLRAESFDIMQVEGIEMARYFMPHGLHLASNKRVQNQKIVFDEHNAEYILQRTAFESDTRMPKRWHAALYSLIQWKKLERYERACCLAASHIAACSDADANAIRTLLNSQSQVTVVPNGVDTSLFVPSDQVCAKPLSEFAMVYAGKMDFRPNIDAMTWFCADILSRIRAELPYAHIVIVGQKPAPRVAALAHQPGIEVTGWVPDTRPYIADAAVYVVPLRMGSGTRLKVLEAMAMGKAIVSTSRGVEGIDLVPDKDALIADTPNAFAQAVVSLLHDPERRRRLGTNARALAQSRYDWRQIVPRFDDIYNMEDVRPLR
jgi:polysaccharide biosynthesis protein PslH